MTHTERTKTNDQLPHHLGPHQPPPRTRHRQPRQALHGAIFAERFEAISRGRFFVGNISVTFTKGIGYRLILKAEDGNRLLEVTERDTIGYDRALTIVAEWMNHPANRDRLPKANR